MDSVTLISRSLHILGAILLFGGAMFTRFVLMPVAEKLPDDQHQSLKSQIAKKWRQVVGIAIGVLIFTGFYNYLVVLAPAHKGDKIYHMLMGMKILLAFVVFFLASVLPGRAKAFEFMRQKNKLWLSITLLLALVVVLLGSFLKVRGPGPTTAVPAVVVPAAQQ